MQPESATQTVVATIAETAVVNAAFRTAEVRDELTVLREECAQLTELLRVERGALRSFMVLAARTLLRVRSLLLQRAREAGQFRRKLRRLQSALERLARRAHALPLPAMALRIDALLAQVAVARGADPPCGDDLLPFQASFEELYLQLTTVAAHSGIALQAPAPLRLPLLGSGMDTSTVGQAQAPRLAMALRQLADRLAGEQGKRVELSISGLERVPEDHASIIYDILSQLLRNAIEHGIETPAQRTTASKPAAGSVMVEYRHRHGQHADLVVQDDGQGLNAPRILEAATSAGVIGADAAAELDPRQASTLIFQPGVSTAGSGRGAGMRIVRDHVKRLGGQIQIATKRGQYLRLRIRIPVDAREAVLRAQA
jgi:two-component system chemotaxis sensor kinase CheA